MYILGISCYYHDAAAVLLNDGMLVAAAEEERFTRKKHDYDFPKQGHQVLPGTGGHHGPGPRLRRLLREAVPQARPHSDDGAADLSAVWKVFRESMITWMLDKLWVAHHAGGRDRRQQRQDSVQRASLVARGQRLFLLAVRRGRDSDGRRRRRVGDGDLRRRQGQRHQAEQADRVSALAWPALQRVHGVPRLRSQRRRVQSHGHGALRRAEVRGQSLEGGQPEQRRIVLAGHGLLQLPPLDREDLQQQVRGVVWRRRVRRRCSSSPRRPASRSTSARLREIRKNCRS